jgi:DNA-binding MarR family transcriptional regulator
MLFPAVPAARRARTVWILDSCEYEGLAWPPPEAPPPMDTSKRSNGARGNGVRSSGAQAWQLMIEIFQSQRHHFERAAAEFDLTKQQAHALYALSQEGPRSMSELAETLACDASSVTGLIDRLEARGLVSRHSVPNDRRMRMLAVTAAGARLLQRYRMMVAHPPPAIAHLPEELQRGLRDVLTRVVDASRSHAPPDTKH